MAKPLKVALVGAGGISGAHMKAYREHPGELKLTAVCDVAEANAARRAKEAGITAVYRDIGTLIKQADFDAVDICTTHDTHAALAIAAAAAGKHVIVEKPMACSMAECRDMIGAAKDSGVTLMVAQMQRYSPSYRGLKKIIDAGELGPIRALRLDAMQNGPDGIGSGSWLMDGKKAGGGVVISVLVHKLDLVRYLVGQVKRVSAACRTLHPAFINGAEDYAAGVMEFESGALGEFFGTYSGFRMPWSESFMIFGDDGMVHAVPQIGNYGGPAFVASRKRGCVTKEFGDMFKGFVPVEPDKTGLISDDGFVNELLHFAECCRSGKEPLSSGRDNLGTMRIVFGIYESGRRGEPVELAAL